MSRQIDLIPEAYTVGYLVRRRALQWAVVAAVAVAIVIGASLVIRKNAGELDRDMVGLRQNVEMMEGWEQNLRELAANLSRTLERQETVNALTGEPYWCGALSDIARATGGDLWITSLSVTQEATVQDKAPEETDAIARVIISGIAASNVEVIRFLRALEESEHLRELELQESAMPGAAGGEVSVEFRVQGTAAQEHT